MKRSPALFIIISLVLALLAGTGCSPAATPPPAATGKVITIGFTTSMTGDLAEQSLEQTNGLKLWISEINNAGGMRLTDGSMVTVAYKTYDDKSSPIEAQVQYTKLITEDNVDFLVGPYSSDLTNTTATLANLHDKLFISSGSASDSTFARSYKTVYQLFTPASKYLTPTLDMLSTVDPHAKRLAVLYGSDTFANSAALSISNALQAQGFATVYQESFQDGETDFSIFVQRLAAAQPDAVLAGSVNAEDGNRILEEMTRQGVQVKLITLLISPCENSFSALGEAALGVMCPSQWEPEMAVNPPATAGNELTWYGPTGTEFILAYQQAYGREPTYYAAGGYTAGLMFQYAIEKYSSINSAVIRTALDEANLATFFGHIQFDTSPEAHGVQIGHELVYAQWQPGADGNLVRRVVWPIDLASSPLIYPLP